MVILIKLEFGDVLFIDEIYCLVWVVEEVFYLVMEDFELDIVLGKGLVVCFIRLELLVFILVGVIICTGFIIGLLRDWFGLTV